MKKSPQKIIDQYFDAEAKMFVLLQTADKTDIYSQGIDEVIKAGEECIEMIPCLMSAFAHRGTGMPRQIRAACQLAIIYEKRKEYAKAIRVCQIALGYNCDYDGTKGGMSARLKRLQGKASKLGG